MKFLKLSWMILFLMTLSTPAFSDGADCSNVPAGGGSTGGGLGRTTDEPVELSNGNFFYDVKDFSYESPGIPVNLSRRYNAQIFSRLENWEQDQGTASWVVENGVLSGQGDRLLTKNSFSSDFNMELDMKAYDAGEESWSSLWLNFRYVDENNRYYFLITQGGGIELSKKVNGVHTQIYYTSATQFNPFEWIHARVRVVGTSIKVWINNSLQIDVTDTPASYSGKIALETYFAHSHYDNIVVDDLTGSNDFSENFNYNDNDLPFGANWQFTYGIRLWEKSNGDIVLENENGTRKIFVKNGTTYTKPFHEFGTIAKQTTPVVSFTYTTKDQTVYTFNSQGQLTSIKDRNDNEMTLSYQDVTATVKSYETASHQLVLDDFQNGSVNQNVLGEWTSDDGCLSNLSLVDKALKLSWNNNTDYWYSILGLNSKKIDLQDYGYLTFRIKGQSGGENFRIELQNDNYSVSFPVANYTTVTTNWQTISIPLSSYSSQGLNLSSVKALALVFNIQNSGTVYIDDITFSETAGTATPSYIRLEDFSDADIYTNSMGQLCSDNSTLASYSFIPERHMAEMEWTGSGSYYYTLLGTGENKVNVSGCDKFRFDVFLVNGNDNFKIFLQNESYSAYVTLASLMTLKKGWHTVEIPLSAFTSQGINLNLLKAIAFEFSETTTGKIYVDNLEFFNSQSTPTTRQYTVNRLTSITDTAGRSIAFQYGTDGKVSQITDPLSRTYHYTYNEEGDMTSSEDARGNSRILKYYRNHNISEHYSREGDFFYYFYAYNDRVIRQYDPFGNRTLFDYRWSTVEVYNNDDDTTIYDFDDTTTQLSSITDAEGHIEYFEYDSNGNIVSKTDKNSNETEYTYDSNGNVLTIKQPGNTNTITMTYNSTYNFIETVTNELGKTTTYTYDSNGNITQIRNPNNHDTDYEYNTRGQVTKITDHNGKEINFTYNTYGQLITVSREIGQETQEIQYTKDIVGRLTTTTDAIDNQTVFVYDENDNITSKTEAYGTALAKQTVYAYDKNDALTQVTAPGNLITQFEYNAVGNLVQKTDPRNHNTVYQYENDDYAQHLVSELLETQDRENHSTIYTYDKANRLISITDAENRTLNFDYDNENNITSYKDPKNNETTFTYNGKNQLTLITFPNASPYGATTHGYDYNEAGQKVSETDRKGTLLLYTYDNAGNLIEKEYPDQTTVTYTYNNLEQLTSVTDRNGVATEYSFDDLDRVAEVVFNSGTLNEKTVSYQYDLNNRRTRLTYPDAQYITYAYNALNQLTNIHDQEDNQDYGFTYDTAGRTSQIALPNGITSTYSFDNDGNITGITNLRGLTPVSNHTYTHDNEGNILTKGGSWGDYTFDYNNVYELIEVVHGLNTTNYTYDGANNRATAAGVSYTSNALNQYTQIGANSLTYSQAGELLTYNGSTYTYNADQKLIQGVKGTNTVNFTYDYALRRSSTSLNNTVQEQYIYDGEDVIADYDASWSLQRKYIFAPGTDNILAMKTTSTNYYYLKDHLGSVRELTNTLGTVIEQYDYTEFGQVSFYDGSMNSITGTAYSNRYLYTGREYNQNLGIYYYRARFYSPEIGRFLTPDPKMFIDGPNVYAYVNNNPISYMDPFGLYKKRYNEYNPYDVLKKCLEENEGNGSGFGFPPSGDFEVVPVRIGDVVLVGGKPGIASPVIPGQVYSGSENSSGEGNNNKESWWSKFKKGLIKLKGDQGYRDNKGKIYKADKMHKDHIDVSNRNNKKISEYDIASGRKLWPDGPKNKNG